MDSAQGHFKQRVRWHPVVIYYLIACGISGPLFYWRTVLGWRGFSAPEFLKVPAFMWGPGIAAIICYFLYRHLFSKQITIWGDSFFKSLIIWIVPFLVWSALGAKHGSGRIDHIYPLTLMVLGFLTIWGEEFGWRWFLQDYLSPLPRLKKYILIGVLWEIWHLRFLSHLQDPWYNIMLSTIIPLFVVIIISIVIGTVTDKTRSLFFSCAIHSWINLCFENSHINTYISSLVMVALCITFYVTWGKSTKVIKKEKSA